MSTTSQSAATPPETEEATTHLRVVKSLHGFLKGKAKREGRVLQRMVEDKLWELVPEHRPVAEEVGA